MSSKEDVRPLKTKEDINNMLWALDRFGGKRDYMLFLVGINTGLRVSDLLQLTVKDVLSLKNDPDKLLKVKEGKTGKVRAINLSNIYEDLAEYAKQVNSKYLFPSRKGDKPVSTTQAYRILQKGADWAEIDGVGTHTMRKTFGYHLYKQTNNLAIVQKALNHRDSDVTLRYIGLEQEDLNKALTVFRLG